MHTLSGVTSYIIGGLFSIWRGQKLYNVRITLSLYGFEVEEVPAALEQIAIVICEQYMNCGMFPEGFKYTRITFSVLRLGPCSTKNI